MFAQHFIELLSFIFYINFNNSTNTLELFKQQNDFIILIINIFGVIFFNVLVYMCYYVYNLPYNIKDNPFKVRMDKLSLLIFIFYMNLSTIHFHNKLIDHNTSYTVQIILYIAINFLLIVNFIQRFKKFYFNTAVWNVFEFFLTYSFFSSVFEVIIYASKSNTYNVESIIGILLVKIFFTVFFMILTYFMNRRHFIRCAKTVLFKEFYNEYCEINELQVFYYFQNLNIIEMKEEKRLSTILDIVYAHQADCLQSSCQCKKIKDNYDNTTILLENIYNKLNFFRNTSINLLYFEYLLIVKKNYLFAYGILKTYIYKHGKKIDTFELLHCYSLLFNAVELYYKTIIWQMNTFLLFNDIFDQIRLTQAFSKKFRKVISTFDCLINYKDKFDNCLKLNNGVIDSYIFAEIDTIVYYCKDFHKTYKTIKQSISTTKLTQINHY